MRVLEETIQASDLPVGAQEVIRSKCPRAVITKAEQTTEKTALGDKVGSEVITKQGKKRITLEFDVDGKFKSKAKIERRRPRFPSEPPI